MVGVRDVYTQTTFRISKTDPRYINKILVHTNKRNVLAKNNLNLIEKVSVKDDRWLLGELTLITK